MEIRDAVASDWPSIWGFMRPILSAGDTYCWPVDTSEAGARVWGLEHPDGRVLVAVVNGAVVGTAEIHPNQPAAGSHIANGGFMVAAAAAGRGIGRSLAKRVLNGRYRGWVHGHAVQCCRRDKRPRGPVVEITRLRDLDNRPKIFPPSRARTRRPSHHPSDASLADPSSRMDRRPKSYKLKLLSIFRSDFSRSSSDF